MDHQVMHYYRKTFTLLILGLILVCAPMPLQAVTAHEILEQVVKQNFSDTFRVALAVKTFKGKKPLSQHFLWLMGKTEQGKTSFFLDFEEPKETKGLRFLFVVEPGKEAKSFMYLPATGKTLPLAVDDQTTDIGGTRLTIEDIQSFVPKGGEKETILKEETVDGRDCYVIQISLPEGKGDRLLWVSKKDFLVVKSQQVDPQGNVKRIFRVLEFFTTEKGTQFPREEEIIVPDKDIRIRLRQESAVFGIPIPDEVMDPEKFGSFRWKD